MASNVKKNDVAAAGSPHFLQPLQDVIAVKDWSVQFEGIIGGDPRPTIRWFYEGVDVTSSPRFSIANLENGRTVLRIEKVILGDGGRYACLISNEHGESSSTATLSIRSMAIAPRFESQLEAIRAKPGEEAKFVVRVFGTPTPIIAWYREGAQVQDSVDYKIRCEGDLYSLTLTHALEDDAGQFTCAAANQQGQATCSALLMVIGEGSSITSSAITEEDSYAHYKKTAKEFFVGKESGRMQVDVNAEEGKTAVKSIMKQSKSSAASAAHDSTVRTVRISPAVGVASIPPSPPTSQQQFPDDFSQISSASSNEAASRRQYASTSAPSILADITEARVPEGQLTLLTCHIVGDPVPDVKWYREGALIESSQDFEITYDGETSHMIIRETFIDDSGQYTCTATNNHGSFSHTFTLQVYEAKKGKGDRPSSAVSDMSMTDYEGFESTEAEMEFISGISENDMTDNEQFTNKGKSNLSPVAEESSTTGSKTRATRLNSRTAESPAGQPPKFIQTPPSMLQMVEGRELRLDCVITGYPQPRVTWARNGVTLQDSYRAKISFDAEKQMHSLVISMMLNDDLGEYMVSATNQFGFISGSVLLVNEDQFKLYEEQAKAKELPPAPKTPKASSGRGRSDRRSAGVSAPSPGMGSQSSHRSLRDKSPSPRTISASPASSRVRKESASPSRRFDEIEQLDIEKFFLPRFISKPDNIVCTEGAATRIDCKVTGRPMPEVTFFVGGNEMQEDYSHRVVIKEDGVRSLIISPAKPEDSGKYTILAKNEAGKAYTSLSLTVIPQEGAEVPRILEKPQSITAKEGDLIRLEVFAVGKPTPEIVWLKDNILLHPEHNNDFKIDGVDGHGLLTIEEANKSVHDAWYTATAVNRHGRDLSRCKVSVEKNHAPIPEQGRKFTVQKTSSARSRLEAGKCDKIHKLENYDDADMYDSSKKQKPRFKKKLESVRQKIYGSAHFECYIIPICDPNMKVEWLLDGKPMEKANRIMSMFEFGYAALDINAVYPRDTGVISCRVTNKFGQAQSSSSLIVKEEKGLIENTQLPSSEQLTNIEVIEQHRQKYSLAHDHPEDLPEPDPIAPSFVLPLEPVTAKEGGSAKFLCRVTAHPAPRVQWYLNGQEIHSSKRFRVWYDGMYNMEIMGVREYDQGRVEIVVTNELGFKKCSAKIEVVNQADFRKLLHKSEYEEEKKYYINQDQGKRMVNLEGVEITENKMKASQLRKVERDEELQSKFSRLADEDQMVRKLETNAARVSERDRSYELHLRKTKGELIHHRYSKTEEQTSDASWLYRSKQTVPNYDMNKVEVTPDMQAPIVIEGLRNSKVTAGTDAKFQVKFEADPPPKVTWVHNEDILRQDGRITWYYPKRSVCELCVRNVSGEDSGAYSVRLVNPAGKAGSQAFLMVKETKEKPLKFAESLQSRMVMELDRSVMLECRASVNCSAYQWRFGETEVYDGEKYQTRRDGDTFWLRISDISLADGGIYSCAIQDDNGRRAFTSAELKVAARPKTIMEKMKDTKHVMGETAVFSTTVSHAEVEGRWMLNGQPIPKEDRFVEEIFMNKRKLIIPCLQPEDDGHIEFQYGSDTSQARVMVKGINVGVTQPLTNQTIFEGDTVRLKLKINKDVLGLWYHNDNYLRQSERHTMTLDRREHMLTIDECQLVDSGTYRFKTGNAESTCQVVVRDFVVTTHLKNLNVLESKSAVFECNLNRQAYTNGIWMFNDKPITTLPEYTTDSEQAKYQIKTIGTKQVLVVRNVQPSDAGSYTFQGRNCFLRSTAALRVEEIVIHEELQDISARETNAVKFSVLVSDSEAEATWTHNGRAVKETSNVHIVKEERQHMLIIDSLLVDDQGSYTFDVGSKSSSATLIVEGTEIIKTLLDVDVLEHEGTTLMCELASSQVHGLWLKNGKKLRESDRIEIKKDGCRQMLIMKNINAKDEAVYAFRVGRTTTAAKVSIISPNFSLGLKNITVAEGADADFAAMVVEQYYEHVHWERNEQQIVSDGEKYVITSDLTKGIHHLMIKDCKKADEAIYCCCAGSTQTSARLFVEKVEIMRKLSGSRVVQSKDFELVTETSKANINGRWYKDGKEVSSSKYVTLTQKGAVHSLRVANANPSDSGEYTFKIGCKSTSAQVQVDAVCITQAMTNTTIKETHRAVFECELSVDDEGLCRWMKNEREVVPDSNVVMSSEGRWRRLEIKHCSETDAGEYRCDILNGVDGCVANLCVSPVRFTTELPKTVRADESTREIDISCDVDSEDVETYWKRDGKRIATTGGRYTTFVRGKTHVLRINEPRTVHSGLYSAVAGSKFTSCQLFIGTAKVQIMKSIKNIEVIENQRATLDFVVSESGLEATWYKNGKKIDFSENERFNYEMNESKHSLHIDDIKFEDAGEYTFEIGEQRSTSYIYVQAPEEPRFVQELRDCIVECGEKAQFTVRASGRPTPTIAWFRNGEEISSGLKYKFLRDEDQHTLVVIEADQRDAGKYVCEARNEFGEFRSTATLQVNTKMVETHEQHQEQEEVHETHLQIVEPLQDFLTREGQSARFTCKIVGSNPHVTWKRNGEEIKATKCFKISEFNEFYQLDITEVYPEDEGTYEIAVSNSLGQTSSKAKLKLDIGAPRVVHPLQPLHVIEGSIVRLSCVIEGERLDVRWFRNGKDITNHPKYQSGRVSENGQCWLVIESSKPEDSGEVRCHASNLSGEAICSTDLLITEKQKLDETRKQYITQIERYQEGLTPYEIKIPVRACEMEFSPTIVEPLRVEARGEETHLRVKFAACPCPEITWFKDGVAIGPSDEVTQVARYRFSYETHAQYHMSALVISQASEEDCGKYECKAWNKLGQVSCSTNLNLKGSGGGSDSAAETYSLEGDESQAGDSVKICHVTMRLANIDRTGAISAMSRDAESSYNYTYTEESNTESRVVTESQMSNYYVTCFEEDYEIDHRDVSTYEMNLTGRVLTPVFNVTIGRTPSPGISQIRSGYSQQHQSEDLRRHLAHERLRQDRGMTKERRRSSRNSRNEIRMKIASRTPTPPIMNIVMRKQDGTHQEVFYSDAENQDSDKYLRRSIQEARDVIMDTDDEDARRDRSEYHRRLPGRLLTPTHFSARVGRTPSPAFPHMHMRTAREQSQHHEEEHHRSEVNARVGGGGRTPTPVMFNIQFQRRTPSALELREGGRSVLSEYHDDIQANYEIPWEGSPPPEDERGRSEMSMNLRGRSMTPSMFCAKVGRGVSPCVPGEEDPPPNVNESLMTEVQLVKPLEIPPEEEEPKPVEKARSVFKMTLRDRRTPPPMHFLFNKPGKPAVDTAEKEEPPVIEKARTPSPEPEIDYKYEETLKEEKSTVMPTQTIETQTSPVEEKTFDFDEEAYKQKLMEQYKPSVTVKEQTIYDETTTTSRMRRAHEENETFNRQDEMSTMPIPPADPSRIKEKALEKTDGENKVLLVETTETTTRTRIKQDGEAKLQVKEEEIRYEVFNPSTGEKYVTTVKQDQEQNKGKLEKAAMPKLDFESKEAAWMIDDTEDRARITELSDDDLAKLRPRSRTPDSYDIFKRPASCDCVRTQSPGVEKFSTRRRWNPKTRAFEIKYVNSGNEEERLDQQFKKERKSEKSRTKVQEVTREEIARSSGEESATRRDEVYSTADSTRSESEEIAALMSEDDSATSDTMRRPPSRLSHDLYRRPDTCDCVRMDSPGMLKSGFRRRWNPRRRGFEMVYVGEQGDKPESPLPTKVEPVVKQAAIIRKKEELTSVQKETTVQASKEEGTKSKTADTKAKLHKMKQDYLASMNDRQQMRFFMQEQQSKRRHATETELRKTSKRLWNPRTMMFEYVQVPVRDGDSSEAESTSSIVKTEAKNEQAIVLEQTTSEQPKSPTNFLNPENDPFDELFRNREREPKYDYEPRLARGKASARSSVRYEQHPNKVDKAASTKAKAGKSKGLIGRLFQSEESSKTSATVSENFVAPAHPQPRISSKDGQIRAENIPLMPDDVDYDSDVKIVELNEVKQESFEANVSGLCTELNQLANNSTKKSSKKSKTEKVKQKLGRMFSGDKEDKRFKKKKTLQVEDSRARKEVEVKFRLPDKETVEEASSEKTIELTASDTEAKNAPEPVVESLLIEIPCIKSLDSQRQVTSKQLIHRSESKIKVNQSSRQVTREFPMEKDLDTQGNDDDAKNEKFSSVLTLATKSKDGQEKPDQETWELFRATVDKNENAVASAKDTTSTPTSKTPQKKKTKKTKKAKRLVQQQKERELKEKQLKEEEEEQRLKAEKEREKEERRIKEQQEKEEEERRLKEQNEKQEEEIRLKEQKRKERKEQREKERRLRAQRLKEQKEKDRLLKEQREKEEEERRLKEQKEKEEEERRFKEQKEKEEEQQRIKEQKEKEEEEQRLKEQKRKERKEQREKERRLRAQRLKEQKEQEEEERRIKEQKEKEQEERRLKEQKEKEEEERRFKEQKEKEEEEQRIKEQKRKERKEQREKERRLRTQKLKEQKEKEEEERRIKEQKEKEEEERRIKEQKEKEEEEQRLKKQKEEEEERLKEQKRKERKEQREKERRLRAERLKEQKEKERILQEQKEKEEEERILKEQKEKEEEERRLKEQKEKEEEETRLLEQRRKERREQREKERLLKEQIEKEEEERRLKEKKEKEEEEMRLIEQRRKERKEQREKERRLKAQLEEELEKGRLLLEQKEKEEKERRLQEEKKKQEEERCLKEQKEKEEQERRLKEQKEKEEEEMRLIEQRRKERREQREKERRLKAQLQEEMEKERLLKEQKEKEEEERRLKEQEEKEEEERRLKEQQEKEEEERRVKEEKEKAAEEQRIKDKKWKERREQLAKERRLKAQKLKEEKEKERLLQEQKEEEERLLQLQKEEEERRLKEQKEKEEEERRLQEQKAKEEEKLRLIDQRMRERREKREKERRLKAQLEEEMEKERLLQLQKEEEERRLKEQKENEEEERRLQEQREKEEEERRLKEEKEKEEERLRLIEQRRKERREQREKERRLKAQLEEEMEKERLRKEQKEKEEEERRLEKLKEKEQEERRLKEQKEKEEEERRIKEQKEKEEEELRLIEQRIEKRREQREKERLLKAQLEEEMEKERLLKEQKEKEEEERRLEEEKEKAAEEQRIKDKKWKERREQLVKERRLKAQKLKEEKEKERLLQEQKEKEEEERRLHEQREKEEEERRVKEQKLKEELQHLREEKERQLKEEEEKERQKEQMKKEYEELQQLKKKQRRQKKQEEEEREQRAKLSLNHVEMAEEHKPLEYPKFCDVLKERPGQNNTCATVDEHYHEYTKYSEILTDMKAEMEDDDEDESTDTQKLEGSHLVKSSPFLNQQVEEAPETTSEEKEPKEELKPQKPELKKQASISASISAAQSVSKKVVAQAKPPAAKPPLTKQDSKDGVQVKYLYRQNTARTKLVKKVSLEVLEPSKSLDEKSSPLSRQGSLNKTELVTSKSLDSAEVSESPSESSNYSSEKPPHKEPKEQTDIERRFGRVKLRQDRRLTESRGDRSNSVDRSRCNDAIENLKRASMGLDSDYDSSDQSKSETFDSTRVKTKFSHSAQQAEPEMKTTSSNSSELFSSAALDEAKVQYKESKSSEQSAKTVEKVENTKRRRLQKQKAEDYSEISMSQEQTSNDTDSEEKSSKKSFGLSDLEDLKKRLELRRQQRKAMSEKKAKEETSSDVTPAEDLTSQETRNSENSLSHKSSVKTKSVSSGKVTVQETKTKVESRTGKDGVTTKQKKVVTTTETTSGGDSSSKTTKTEEIKSSYTESSVMSPKPFVTEISDEDDEEETIYVQDGQIVEEEEESNQVMESIEIDELEEEYDYFDPVLVSKPSLVEDDDEQASSYSYSSYSSTTTKVTKLGESEDDTSVQFEVMGDYPITPHPIKKKRFYAPCFRRSLTSMHCYENDAAEFVCQVEGEATTRWFVNSVEVEPASSGYSILVEESNDMHSLIIEKPTHKKHNGCVVKCEITNIYGSASSEASLTVEKAKPIKKLWIRSNSTDRPPSVIRPIESPVLERKQDVRLECVMRDSSKVEWRKDGKPLTEHPKMFRKSSWKTEDGETKACLEILGMTPDRSGVYTCVGKSDHGEVASTSTQVAFTNQELFETSTTSEQTVTTTEENADENDATANPEQKEPDPKQFSLKNLNFGFGAKVYHFDINPTLTDRPSLSRPFAKKRTEENYIRPAFILKPKHQRLIVNSDAKFQCSFVACPKPDVIWFFNDRKVDNAFPRRRLEYDLKHEMFSYVSTLIIRHCQKEDAGTYKILVRNREGETKAKTTLEINDRIKKPDQPNKKTEKRQHSFKTVRRHHPLKPVKRHSSLKSSKLSSPLSSIFSSVSSLSVGDSLFSDCESVDTRDCSFLNSSSSESSCSSANSSETLKASSITSSNHRVPMDEVEDKSVEMGEPFSFHVYLPCWPRIRENWSKDGVEISSSQKNIFNASKTRIVGADGDGDRDRYMLSVDAAELEHSGDYTFSAKSQKGNFTKNFKLIVADNDHMNETPIFTKELAHVDARHAGKIRLKCRLKYANATKISWYLNGEEITKTRAGVTIGKSLKAPYFELKKVLHSDAGEYTCTASNDAGSTSCSAILHIQGR